MEKNTKQIIIYSLAVIYLAQLASYYPRFPETVAIHFGIDGTPDRFAQKAEFAVFMLLLWTILVGGSLLVGYLTKTAPTETVNIPNKDYWFAPERRALALKMINEEGKTFKIGLLMFLLTLNEFCYRANVVGGSLSPFALVGILAFLAFAFWWTIRLRRRFAI